MYKIEKGIRRSQEVNLGERGRYGHQPVLEETTVCRGKTDGQEGLGSGVIVKK